MHLSILSSKILSRLPLRNALLAKGEKVTANSEIANEKGEKIKAYLITGEMVTKENIDKVLIESGYYTKEQVYGNN